MVKEDTKKWEHLKETSKRIYKMQPQCHIIWPFVSAICTAVAAVGVGCGIYSAEVNKNTKWFDLMNCTADEFKNKLQIIEPLEKDKNPISVDISASDPDAGSAPMRAINAFYGDLFKNNINYFKQDLLFTFNNQLQKMKQDEETKLSGSFKIVFDDVKLNYGLITESDRRQLLVCDLVGHYEADLTGEEVWTTVEQVHTKLTGKMEFKNMFVEIVANNKGSDKWTDFNFKFWMATHTGPYCTYVSQITSTAEGTVTVKEKDKTSETIYTRVEAEPIVWKDGEIPALEDIYRDPIIALFYSLDTVKSYSTNALEVKLNYVE